MADGVRFVLEGMVPELASLEGRGYFSKSEVAGIVREREAHEYAMRRQQARKRDFLRAVEYEERLERLRALRRRTRGIAGKTRPEDRCFVRRAHFIFSRATRKWRGDLGLWAAWLDLCRRTGSRRTGSRALSRALALNPTAAPLWVAAAAWEFESGVDAHAARTLMQHGLRSAGESEPRMWQEYFRLEILHALRLRARRAALGIVDDIPPRGDEGGADGDGQARPTSELTLKSGDEGMRLLLRGAAAGAVYRAAVAAHPEGVAFRAGFLRVLEGLADFPGKEDLVEQVRADVRSAFPHDPAARALEARLAARVPTSAAGADNLAGLDAGMRAIGAPTDIAGAPSPDQGSHGGAPPPPSPPSPSSSPSAPSSSSSSSSGDDEDVDRSGATASFPPVCRRLALEWCLGTAAGAVERLAAVAEGRAEAGPDEVGRLGDLRRAALERARALADGARDTGEPALRAQAADVLLANLDVAAAGRAAEGLPIEGARLAALASDGTGAAAGGDRGLASALVSDLGAEPAATVPEAWLAAAEAVAAEGDRAAAVALAAALVARAEGGRRGSSAAWGEAGAAALRATDATLGREAALRLSRELSALPALGPATFHAGLDLELAESARAQASTSVPAAGARAIAASARLFERAVVEIGAEDTELWLRYLKLARQAPLAGLSQGALHDRAVRALRDPAEFVRAASAVA